MKKWLVENKWIAIIIGGALLIRLASLFFALPYSDVFGDELNNTIIAFKILENHSLILTPEMGGYLPPLYSYLLAPIYGLIGFLGIISGAFSGLLDFKEFVILHREWFLLPGRFLSALFGAGTVYLTYIFARKIFDKRVALLASFLLSISFLHVHESQVSHVWTPLVFFTVLGAYGFYCLSVSGERKWYWLAVISLGLGYAIGQIPIILYPFFIYAHFLFAVRTKTKFWNKNFIEANVLLMSLVAAFTFLNFYTVYKHFYDVLLALSQLIGWKPDFLANVRLMPSAIANFSLGNNWLFIFKSLFYDSPVVLLAALAGTAVVLRKFRIDARIVFLSVLPLYTLFVFSFIFYHFLCRYTLPAVPFLAISASYFVFWLWDRPFWKKSRVVLVFLIAAVSLYSLAASGLYSFKLLKPYTLSSAIEWVYGNIPSGKRVVADVYLNSNKAGIEFLQKYNMYGWLDTRKKYLLQMPEARYPDPNYFLIDTNLTDVASLPDKEKKADYGVVTFYSGEQEREQDKILDVFGPRELVFSLYPRGDKEYAKGLLNLEPHFFLGNIWSTRQIGPNVEIYRFVK
ncbi:MAG: phospholipid carrier-dependent glycosyltransferase [Candidatus Portnoybacteria bacterium]|nr:phospholipid carrier-dependent glycosyltransferase [Candidatus Portnoybacteria bacterium]MDD4982496.1 phospholipid carrier-dependent glycosyltransferase [Candidatus Portnoybacteria bacterium]